MSAIILLVLLGAALVFLETVLVGGVWAIAGILCCAWAVWMAFAEYGIWAASIVGAVSIALCIAAFLVWLYVIPKTPFGKKFYLNSKQDGKAPSADFSRLVGCKGVAATVLVPSGKVQIGEKFYPASVNFAGHRLDNCTLKFIIMRVKSFNYRPLISLIQSRQSHKM